MNLELSRLTAALAAGGNLGAMVEAVREREARLNLIADEVRRERAELAAFDVSLDVVMAEVRRRVDESADVLAEESTQSRRRLRTLLKDRLVFTPELDEHACDLRTADLPRDRATFAVDRVWLGAVPKRFALYVWEPPYGTPRLKWVGSMWWLRSGSLLSCARRLGLAARM